MHSPLISGGLIERRKEYGGNGCHIAFAAKGLVTNDVSRIIPEWSVGWTLLGVKIETSMNRLANFHKVGPGRGEHDGENKEVKAMVVAYTYCF